MNEQPTKKFTDRGSFEERVFARFDAIEERLERLEARSYDTKPIWERALSEIAATRNEVGELKVRLDGLEAKVDQLSSNVDELRSSVTELRSSVTELRSNVDELRSNYGNLHNELVETRRDFKIKLAKRLDLLLDVFVDNRDDMRQADERLARLESKLA